MLNAATKLRFRNWAGNLGLLMCGIAAFIAAAKYANVTAVFIGEKGPSGSAWDWKGVLRDFAPAVSWILVILGWWVVRCDQNGRERRKEVRSEVEDLAGQIHEIELRAYDYLPTTGVSGEGRSLENRLRVCD